MSDFQGDKRNYLIFSPYLSQSISCAKRLRLQKNNNITGAYLQCEESLFYRNYSKYYDKSIIIDSIDHRLFKEYDYIIPTGALSTKVIFDYCNQLNYERICFNKDALTASDKLFILSLAESLDIPIPTSWESINNIPPNISVFYKPKLEGLPGDRSWVSSRNDLPESVKNNNYIYQERIESPGVYGYGFVANNGKVLASFSHFEIVSQPLDGGSAAVIKPYNDGLLDEYSQRLIRELNYSGWGLVEYKWCPGRKDFVLMEINAKLWASIELAFMLNPDFTKLILSIETSILNTKGLVWIDRLIRNGLSSIWNAKYFILHYKCIYEPINYTKHISKFINRFLNKAKAII